MPITCLFQKVVRFMRLTGLILVALVFLTCNSNVFAKADKFSEKAIIRHFRYILTVSNQNNEVSSGGKLFTFAPVPVSARQYKTELSASEKFETVKDDNGSEILQFNLGNIPPLGKKIITVRGITHLSPKPLKNNEATNNKRSTDIEKFTKAEKHIESNNEKLIKIAKRLKKPSDEETVKSIYKWVTNYLKKSNYTAPVYGALFAYKAKKGDCTEYACLVAALCRTLKIPARVAGGFVLSKNKILTPNLYHDWTQVLVNDCWRVVDSHGRSYMNDEETFIAFRYLGSKGPVTGLSRYRIIGEGLTVKMEGSTLKARAKDQPCNCR